MALDAPQTIERTVETVGTALVERGACFGEAVLGEVAWGHSKGLGEQSHRRR
jgi:hypothetical protein